MFSIRLKELRQKHNLSQKEFAEILKVSTGTVGNWEVGLREPDFKMLIKIADIFNVSCDYILDRFTDENDIYEKTMRVPITPIEEEFLTVFRHIGKKFGEERQQSAIKILNSICEFDK